MLYTDCYGVLLLQLDQSIVRMNTILLRMHELALPNIRTSPSCEAVCCTVIAAIESDIVALCVLGIRVKRKASIVRGGVCKALLFLRH